MLKFVDEIETDESASFPTKEQKEHETAKYAKYAKRRSPFGGLAEFGILSPGTGFLAQS